MDQKEIICTVCPMGCRITVTGQAGMIQSVSGNTCPRGEEYARNEFVRPMRLLTSVAKTQGVADMPLLAIRSDRVVPRDMLFACMEEIRRLCLTAPVHRGDVLITNVAGTGANIIASADLV